MIVKLYFYKAPYVEGVAVSTVLINDWECFGSKEIEVEPPEYVEKDILHNKIVLRTKAVKEAKEVSERLEEELEELNCSLYKLNSDIKP